MIGQCKEYIILAFWILFLYMNNWDFFGLHMMYVQSQHFGGRDQTIRQIVLGIPERWLYEDFFLHA